MFENGRGRQGGKKRKDSNVRGAALFRYRFCYEVDTAPSIDFVMTTRQAQNFITIHLDLNVTIKMNCPLFVPKYLPNLSFVCPIQKYVTGLIDKTFVYDIILYFNEVVYKFMTNL